MAAIKHVDVMTVAHDLSEAATNMIDPGSAWGKASRSLEHRSTKGELNMSKKGQAFWKQFSDVGATIATDLVDYLESKGLGDAHTTGKDCAFLYGTKYGNQGRTDNFSERETPWSYKVDYSPNDVAKEGEAWVAMPRKLLWVVPLLQGLKGCWRESGQERESGDVGSVLGVARIRLVVSSRLSHACWPQLNVPA
jgi:hypothetical protein